jgi:hypothetical protein
MVEERTRIWYNMPSRCDTLDMEEVTKMERISKKKLAIGMFERGVRVEAIAELLRADPAYIANALIEAGHAPSYADLYTTTGPQNRYAQMLAGSLRFKDVEAARASVDRIDAMFKGFSAIRDRRGMHQCQVLALTGMNRAEGIGKWEEAEVFAEWLSRNLQVRRPQGEVVRLPVAAAESQSAETQELDRAA